MKILLTNDDSQRSPLLEFIIEKLRSLGTLTVVVPKHEQSWRGKSLTRFGVLHVEEISLFGQPAFTVDGTPADCVNLGIYHLCGAKPDLVVSGINAGLNAGMSFVFSSGTVGACLEANIAGIPGIAFSQRFDSETMARYVADYAIREETSAILRKQIKIVLDRFFPKFLAHHELFSAPLTWNVNFPLSVGEHTEFKLSNLGYSTYGSYFVKDGQGYRHQLHDLASDPSPGTDAHNLFAGHVTITPLEMREFGRGLSPEVRALLELWPS